MRSKGFIHKNWWILLVALCLLIGVLAVVLITQWPQQTDPTAPDGTKPPTEQTEPLPPGTIEDVPTDSEVQPSGETTVPTRDTEPSESETSEPTESESTSEPTESTEQSSQAAPPPQTTQATEPTEPTEPEPTEPQATSDDIVCDAYARFSGQYVEDGRDEPVENVAAILVTNRSTQFLDLATLTYDIDGKTATFVVTGLPAGRSAWVMEASRMTAAGDADFIRLGCTASFRSGVTASTDRVTITAEGNTLTATNCSDETLENVFIYYKRVHTDGNYFGGITYVVNFGTLQPGASAESLAGHYKAGETEIIRIGWQTD